jgi:hypothetical protein
MMLLMPSGCLLGLLLLSGLAFHASGTTRGLSAGEPSVRVALGPVAEATKPGNSTTPAGTAKPMPRSQPPAFPSNPEVVVRWSFLFEDVDDRMGGGYLSGEFLLLHDGRLFRRSTSSQSSAKTTMWRAGLWFLDPIWRPANDVPKLVTHLTGRGFDLYPPSPVPVDAISAGPFPGIPKPAGAPLYPARRSGR